MSGVVDVKELECVVLEKSVVTITCAIGITKVEAAGENHNLNLESLDYILTIIGFLDYFINTTPN
jgi:hypothetical protein